MNPALNVTAPAPLARDRHKSSPHARVRCRGLPSTWARPPRGATRGPRLVHPSKPYRGSERLRRGVTNTWARSLSSAADPSAATGGEGVARGAIILQAAEPNK